MIDTEKYQGSANYDTWNVSLWLWNDEAFYKDCRILVNTRKPSAKLRQYVKDLIRDNLITDKITMKNVQFLEIVKDFRQHNKECREIKKNTPIMEKTL